MKSCNLLPSYWSLDAIMKYTEYRERSRFSEEEAMLKDKFIQDVLSLKDCGTTKVEMSYRELFKVQEQSLG